MKKKIIYISLIIISLFSFTGCNSKKDVNNNQNNTKIEKKDNNPNEVTSSVQAIINGKEYII